MRAVHDSCCRCVIQLRSDALSKYHPKKGFLIKGNRVSSLLQRQICSLTLLGSKSVANVVLWRLTQQPHRVIYPGTYTLLQSLSTLEFIHSPGQSLQSEKKGRNDSEH